MSKNNNKEQVSQSPHIPVLLNEVVENIAPKDGGTYLDCTFGAGGYTKAILNAADCFVTGLDQDPMVLEYVKGVKETYDNRFDFVQTNFADCASKLEGKQFDGIVLDLGISSMQVDSAERGFSFMKEGPLDMRMSQGGQSAVELIATISEEELANLIYKYGEEVQSRQIAKSIIEARKIEPIETTLQLAEVVREAMHFRKAKIDPATKTFQAIRIHINKELESLEKFLDSLEPMLKPGAKILVVSFHSLEDSIVKYFFKEHSAKKVARSKYSKKADVIEEGKWLKLQIRKAITPTREEIMQNPRSRSGRLRVAEKIGGSYVV